MNKKITAQLKDVWMCGLDIAIVVLFGGTAISLGDGSLAIQCF
jgi:hypothetical protein